MPCGHSVMCHHCADRVCACTYCYLFMVLNKRMIAIYHVHAHTCLPASCALAYVPPCIDMLWGQVALCPVCRGAIDGVIKLQWRSPTDAAGDAHGTVHGSPR